MESFFATVPLGLVEVLKTEIVATGAKVVAQNIGGVSFEGTLEHAYQLCLWSRVANRVLKPILRFNCPNDKVLYEKIASIKWTDHLAPMGSLAVDFFSTHSTITHTHFGALRVKDAIVDQLRDSEGNRPNIDKETPDVRINLYVSNDEAIASIDLSGDSLHKRGYRVPGADAPLKENLAAGLLLLADYPLAVQAQKPFMDPMCGSGTIAIEAALIAADCAPGLFRKYWGFWNWKQHDPVVWKKIHQEAQSRFDRGRAKAPVVIVGMDRDSRALALAKENAVRARVASMIQFQQNEFTEYVLPETLKATGGVLIMNPPYGERLGEAQQLEIMYGLVGDELKQQFKNWTAWILTSKGELMKKIGLRASKRIVLFNGSIECRLLKFDLF